MFQKFRERIGHTKPGQSNGVNSKQAYFEVFPYEAGILLAHAGPEPGPPDTEFYSHFDLEESNLTFVPY